MTQNADEGQAGVNHPGTEPPEPKCRRVATRQPRHRHQREALSQHQEGAQSALERILSVWPRAVALEGRACTSVPRLSGDIHRVLQNYLHL